MTNKFSRLTALMAFSLAVLFFTSFQISAAVNDTFTIDDLKYTILTEEGSTGTVSVGKNSDTISGSIVIPDSVENNSITYSVTFIGDYAFQCEGLTSVVIGSGVTSTGNYTFSYCSSLTNITVNSDNQNYSSMDGVLFNKDQTKLIQYPPGKEGEYMIPDSVISIGDYAFSVCSGLTSITIPDSMTSIGMGAFAGCSGLNSVVIGNGVTSIGNGAFWGCNSLTNIVIPASVTFIGSTAFYSCSGLTNVEIGNGVTSIGDFAFSKCSSLISVVFKGNAPEINGNIFQNCPHVTVYYYEGTIGWTNPWAGVLTQMIELPKVGDTFMVDDFQYRILSCNGTTGTVSVEKQFYTIPSGDITIPATVENSEIAYQVTEIGTHAFDTCYGLTHVTIPDSVTVIGAYAFDSCFNLASVTMGNGVKEIGYWAFNRCLALKEIEIPDSVESIKSGAFSECWNLESIYFKGDALELGRDAFWNTQVTIYYREGTQGWTDPWGGCSTVMIREEKPALSYSRDGESMVLKWEEKADMTLQVLDEKTDNYLDIKENIHTKDGVCTYRAPMKCVKAFYRLMEK